MNQSFEIKFDFVLADSDITISLTATAIEHHSQVYYVVDNFHSTGSPPQKNAPSILPTMEIKEAKRGNSHIWVHRDSGRESLLSIEIGRAIEKAIRK